MAGGVRMALGSLSGLPVRSPEPGSLSPTIFGHRGLQGRADGARYPSGESRLAGLGMPFDSSDAFKCVAKDVGVGDHQRG